MLKTRIKASNISNLTDARYYAAWAVNWLGLNMRASMEDALSLEEVKTIKDWVEGPVIVGELDILDFEVAKSTIDNLSLEAIQVGMFTPVEFLQSLQDYTILQEVIIDKTTTFASLNTHIATYFDVVDYFLLDFEKNGLTWNTLQNNAAISLEQLQALCRRQQIILSIDCKAAELESLLAKLQPYGLSIKGGAEEKVGFKSFEEVDELFEALSMEE